jgi:hypothetical protein
MRAFRRAFSFALISDREIGFACSIRRSIPSNLFSAALLPLIVKVYQLGDMRDRDDHSVW